MIEMLEARPVGMNLEAAKADAIKRAKEVGLVWHVIYLSVHDSYDTVSSHYFVTHPGVESHFESEDYYGDNQYRGGKNRKDRRKIQRILDKLLKRRK